MLRKMNVTSSTLFLRMSVILIGIPVLALCIFLVPEIADYAAKLSSGATYVKYLVFLDLYASAIPFYFALYQTLRLLNYIDKNTAFSELSIRALKNIKYCAVLFSILYMAATPIFYLMAESSDAPGILAIGLAIIFASLVIAVFSAVLQRLLKQAIDIKSENDFTV